MKLQVKSNFSFAKLAKEMPGILEKYSANAGRGVAKGIKKSIETGTFTELSDITMDIRIRGISPNSGYTKTSSNKPLIHTGRLRNSIRYEKDGIKMNEYGKFQNDGYKTVVNGFTKSYFKSTGKQLAGKIVDPRPFIDKGLAIETPEGKKANEDLSKNMRKALMK